MQLLSIKELNFGFSDAENYKRHENKELFNSLFIRDTALEKICQPTTSFIVGDKGTGKTAYAVYFANNDFKNNLSSIRYIRETEYQKFIALKKEKHLELSDYCSIWKVIIYLLLAEQVHERENRNPLFGNFTRLRALHEAIQEYYIHAFSPEIIYALRFIQESKIAAELLAKHANLLGEKLENVEFSESRFQTNLLYIQKNFENTLRSLKLQKNHILFIDGIDIRPESVPYPEYLECIKGLANAVWEINNDFFPTIRHSTGRLRAVLLIRPDIFVSLGLQNQNTKIRDNSAFLHWGTTYRDHRTSQLFSVADRLLSHGQTQMNGRQHGDTWDYYFPFDSPTEKVHFEKPSSFISFLRFALYRPRDIVTMLRMLQERFLETSGDQQRVFSSEDFDDSTFRRNYADYLLGEVKDQLSFYYSSEDYEMFLKFFTFLDGKNKFSYDEYLFAYDQHRKFMSSVSVEPPRFMSTGEDFLQFLFELNVLCYIEHTDEDDTYLHWCFRDRTYSNIAPKVKLEQRYEIFYGMSKALNTGRRFSKHNS